MSAHLIGWRHEIWATTLFRKRQFEPIIIVTCVRWYCRFSLSLRDLKELMTERGLAVDRAVRRVSSLGRSAQLSSHPRTEA